MRWPLRTAVALVFLAAATAKLADIDGTLLLFERLLPLHGVALRAATALLIVLECALGVALLYPLAVRWRRRADSVATVACAIFLGGSMWLWSRGVADCACFGTLLSISPAWTVVKNAFLFVACDQVRRGSANLASPLASRELTALSY